MNPGASTRAAGGFLRSWLTLLCTLCLTDCCIAVSPPDKSTQDALNEIDAAGAPTTAAAAPKRAASSSPAGAAATPPTVNRASLPEARPSISWLPLIRFFAPMLAAAAALAIAGGVAGTFVLLRREALVALALPQVVAVGAAVGMRYNWPTLPPALVAAAAAVIYLAAIRRRGSGPWVLPALYIAGLSISFLLIANKGQDVADLQKLFTGVDVAVAPADALIAVPVLLLVAIFIAILWRRWLLIAQAPAAAELAGLRPARWDALFLVFLAIVLLLGTNALGVVMALVMLFLPAAAALAFARSIPAAMAIAAILGLLFLASGFVVSNLMSWPLSQTVGGIGFAFVALSHLVARRG